MPKTGRRCNRLKLRMPSFNPIPADPFDAYFVHSINGTLLHR
jgi:hypothetical protein